MALWMAAIRNYGPRFQTVTYWWPWIYNQEHAWYTRILERCLKLLASSLFSILVQCSAKRQFPVIFTDGVEHEYKGWQCNTLDT